MTLAPRGFDLSGDDESTGSSGIKWTTSSVPAWSSGRADVSGPVHAQDYETGGKTKAVAALSQATEVPMQSEARRAILRSYHEEQQTLIPFIECRGQLGFWDVPANVLQQVLRYTQQRSYG